MSFNELSPRKQSFIREVFDPSLTEEQRKQALERSGYSEYVGVEGIQSVIDGMVRGVAAVSTPIVPGWVTPALTSMLQMTPEAEAALYKLNKRVQLTSEDVTNITRIYVKDGVSDQDALSELERRRDNLFHLVFEGDKPVGVCKLFDTSAMLDIDEARKVGLWAQQAWREEKYGDHISVNHAKYGDRYDASVNDDGVAIGCQYLPRPDVLRICALMGWGILEKQEGPDAPASVTKEAEPA